MSMYNMMYGVNPFSKVLCEAIGVKFEDIARFRDSWYRNGIVGIHTRTGGGNRECYCYDRTEEEKTVEMGDGSKHYSGCYAYRNQLMTENPNYVLDYDDDFDSTYATFEFKVPEKVKEVLDSIFEMLEKGATRGDCEKLLEKVETKANAGNKEDKRAYEIGKMVLDPAIKAFLKKEKDTKTGA